MAAVAEGGSVATKHGAGAMYHTVTCAEAVMRAGVHYSQFTLVRYNGDIIVGIAEVGFDPHNGRATDTEKGWVSRNSARVSCMFLILIVFLRVLRLRTATYITLASISSGREHAMAALAPLSRGTSLASRSTATGAHWMYF